MMWRAYAEIEHSVRTGDPGFDHAFGMTLWEHLDKDPQDCAFFDRTMTELSTRLSDLHVRAFRPERFARIADIAGGHGRFLAELLRASPAAEGVLVEREAVLGQAPAVLREHGVADRVTLVRGDLFEDLPPEGCDAYLLKAILHNWPDDRAERILHNLRSVIGDSGARLFLLEQVVDGAGGWDHAKFLDIDMMVIFGGDGADRGGMAFPPGEDRVRTGRRSAPRPLERDGVRRGAPRVPGGRRDQPGGREDPAGPRPLEGDIMEQQNTGTGPVRILRLATAFQGSRVLASAVELGVFAALAEGPATQEDLSARLGLHPRGAGTFLDCLVALGLLTRRGRSYRGTADAEEYLVPGSVLYVGGYARIAGNHQYRVWEDLTRALRTGQAQVPRGPGSFDGHTDPAAAAAFMSDFLEAMDAVNARVARDLVTGVDWSARRDVVDLGGARGDLALRLVQGIPGLHAICFDLPQVRPAFEEHLSGEPGSDRVRFVGGDFLTDPLPEADAVVLGHVLHFLAEDRRVFLLRRVGAALRAGGEILIYDRMIDQAGPRPFDLFGSLNMLLTTPDGAEYTVEQCRGWLSAAGLDLVGSRPVAGTDAPVRARPSA